MGIGLVVAPVAAPAYAASTPSGLRAADVAGNGIAITWTAVKGAPAYRVQFSTKKSMGSAKTMDVDSNYIEWSYLNPEPSANSGRLKPGGTYYFRVKVITKVDLDHTAKSLSRYSRAIKVKTPTAGSDRYLAPAGLKATSRSATSLYVSWNSRGPGISYRVKFGTAADLSGADTKVFDYSGGVLAGLRANTTYYWQVQTISKGGEVLSRYSGIQKVGTHSVSSPAIKVASNNICSWASGCSKYAGWDARRAAIATSLAAQAPDIIAMQEADRSPELIADLNQRTGRSFRIVAKSDHAELAYDTDRFSAVESGVHTWNADGSKNAVWAILADQKDGGRKLLAVSVHLTNSDSGSAQTKRKAEAKELVALIAEHNDGGKLPVIAAGDFNVSKRKADHPTVYSTITNAGLIDPLGNPSDSRYVSNADGVADHRIDAVYASANQYKRHALRAKWPNGYDVDYIWHSQGVHADMFQVVVDLDTSGDFRNAMPPSDHNMLVSSFHLV
ncbi:MAG TPA: fibronectin type III domain-containing protein [Propionicimonas sp.]|jgi:endonuclease/exonuclease/phosphatase family metal-dependent hydrolase